MMRRSTSQFLVAAKYFCFALAIFLPGEAFSLQVVAPEQINPELVQPEAEHRLVVKFNDDLRARCVNGKVFSKDENANRFAADLAVADNLKFHPLIRLDQAKLNACMKKAAENSGRKQPDLCAIMVVDGAKEKLQQVALTLKDSLYVEWVEFERLGIEPPTMSCDADIAPITQDFSSDQDHFGPNPGLNLLAFHAISDSRGQGVKIADCEYWFDGEHEDLCNIIAEPGQTPHAGVFAEREIYVDHGTCSLGVVVGGVNGYGVNGISPEADAYFFPEWTDNGFGGSNFRRTTAIANAVATVDPGDIVLLEMQTLQFEQLVPAEANTAVWNIVRMASDMGVIVVAAAGNGDADLDTFNAYQSLGDSGAIIVGAGSANLGHNKLSFSSFGSRVNVQGWGRSVFTSGGTNITIAGDVRQSYTPNFSGTSSASAMVAGVCALLQGHAKAMLGRALTPAEMREALTETGHPQGNGGNIGPFPDMVEAANYIINNFEPACTLGDVDLNGTVDFLDIAPFIAVLFGGTNQCEADCDQNGVVGFLDIAPFITILSGS